MAVVIILIIRSAALLAVWARLETFLLLKSEITRAGVMKKTAIPNKSVKHNPKLCRLMSALKKTEKTALSLGERKNLI